MKHCVCCLNDPPEKYRWKHRICDQCRKLLSLVGHVSYSGFQAQDYGSIPHCLPGFVYFYGIFASPKPSALQSVDLPEGALHCLLESAPAAVRQRTVGRKWAPVTAADLPLFLSASPPHMRWLCRLIGPFVPMGPACTFDMCDYNAFCAVLIRVFRKPKFLALPGLLKRCALLLAHHLLPSFFSERVYYTILEWWNTMPSNRKTPLWNAILLYNEHGFTKKFSKIKAFIKGEMGPAFSKTTDNLIGLDYSCPRLIQAPHDVTHVVVGPKVKPMLSWLKHDWDWDGGLFYGSREPVALQAWLDLSVTLFPDGVVIWIDYSMYDNSYSPDHWGFMYHLYGELMTDTEFAAVMRAWEKPFGRVRCFRYRGRSMNASGRDDTALANGVLNGLAVSVSLAATWYRISVLEVEPHHVKFILTQFRASVCGDDSIIFGPSMVRQVRFDFVSLLSSNISQFGFEAKAFSSDRFVDAVYLGHRPLPVAGRWYWSKTIGRAIYKLGYQMGVVGDPAAHLHGVMQMHSICSPHVPILGDIANAYLKCAKGTKINIPKFDENKPWTWMTNGVSPGCYAQDTIAGLVQAYSVRRDFTRMDLVPFDTALTAADIADCQNYIHSAVVRGVRALDHWVLERMILVDEQ